MFRYPLAAFAVVVSVCLVSAGAPVDAKKIVGSWELTKGDGPPGAKVEFTADGKMIMTVSFNGKTVSLNGSYSVAGDKITTTMEFGGEKKSDVSTIQKLDATDLHVKDDKGKVEEFKRVVKK